MRGTFAAAAGAIAVVYLASGGIGLSAAHALSCVGDCNGDGSVIINEVITCVNAALGLGTGGCPRCDSNRNDTVEISELIESVKLSLAGFALETVGQCLRPCRDDQCDAGATANGLVACDLGVMRATECDEQGTCDRGAVETEIGEDGTFSVTVCLAATRPIQLRAEENGYRVIDIGSPRATGRGGGAGPRRLDVSIDPISEAAARVLTGNDLARFDQSGIVEVNSTVSDALSDASFAGLDDEAAATMAAATAAADPRVMDVVDCTLSSTLRIRVGTATAAAGGTATVNVALCSGGNAIAGTQNDLSFDVKTPILSTTEGTPDCRVNPAIRKRSTTFSFLPPGCSPGATCTAVRALVLDLANTDPIPAGAELYTCTVAIAADASGAFPLPCSGSLTSPPEGGDIATPCTPGTITVSE
jgi:hypothetical protein